MNGERRQAQCTHSVFILFTIMGTIMPSFILSIIPLQTLLGLSDILGHFLLMNVQINGDEAQMLTDSGQSDGA